MAGGQFSRPAHAQQLYSTVHWLELRIDAYVDLLSRCTVVCMYSMLDSGAGVMMLRIFEDPFCYDWDAVLQFPLPQIVSSGQLGFHMYVS